LIEALNGIKRAEELVSSAETIAMSPALYGFSFKTARRESEKGACFPEGLTSGEMQA
jgi:hypothetical protein